MRWEAATAMIDRSRMGLDGDREACGIVIPALAIARGSYAVSPAFDSPAEYAKPLLSESPKPARNA